MKILQRIARWGIVVGATSQLVACSSAECSSFEVAAPIITVVDADTNKPICDATIFIVSEVQDSGTGMAVVSPAKQDSTDAGIDGSSLLGTSPAGGIDPHSCSYGIVPLEGLNAVYALRVEYPGYVPETVSNVYVRVFSCMAAYVPPEQVVILIHRT